MKRCTYSRMPFALFQSPFNLIFDIPQDDSSPDTHLLIHDAVIYKFKLYNKIPSSLSQKFNRKTLNKELQEVIKYCLYKKAKIDEIRIKTYSFIVDCSSKHWPISDKYCFKNKNTISQVAQNQVIMHLKVKEMNDENKEHLNKDNTFTSDHDVGNKGRNKRSSSEVFGNTSLRREEDSKFFTQENKHYGNRHPLEPKESEHLFLNKPNSYPTERSHRCSSELSSASSTSRTFDSNQMLRNISKLEVKYQRVLDLIKLEALAHVGSTQSETQLNKVNTGQKSSKHGCNIQ